MGPPNPSFANQLAGDPGFPAHINSNRRDSYHLCSVSKVTMGVPQAAGRFRLPCGLEVQLEWLCNQVTRSPDVTSSVLLRHHTKTVVYSSAFFRTHLFRVRTDMHSYYVADDGSGGCPTGITTADHAGTLKTAGCRTHCASSNSRTGPPPPPTDQRASRSYRTQYSGGRDCVWSVRSAQSPVTRPTVWRPVVRGSSGGTTHLTEGDFSGRIRHASPEHQL